MSNDQKNVKLGEGVADSFTKEANKQMSDMGKMLVDVVAEFLKGKIQDIDLEKLFSKKNEKELVELWSTKLAEQGLIPKGYAGLPDKYLLHNVKQDGYLDGLYVAYLVTMMSLVDHGASEEMILEVRKDMYTNMVGHDYKEKEEYKSRFKNDKYKWIAEKKTI